MYGQQNICSSHLYVLSWHQVRKPQKYGEGKHMIFWTKSEINSHNITSLLLVAAVPKSMIMSDQGSLKAGWLIQKVRTQSKNIWVVLCVSLKL